MVANLLKPLSNGSSIPNNFSIYSIWNTKTWSGLSNFSGNSIWKDGDNIYYSYDGTNYVLNKSTGTWNPKTWYGLTSFYGSNIWKDGDNIYYSDSNGNNYFLREYFILV